MSNGEGIPQYTNRMTDKIKSHATGFFRVEEQDGTWWMIDPNGYGFIMLGTDHASYHVHYCQVLGYSPHERYCRETFGSEEEWATMVGERLARWNFNTLPVRHCEYLRYSHFAHIETLSVGTGFTRNVDSITPAINWTGFPDVFSPQWPQWCDRMAREKCAPNAGDPWLIGYFLDNELQWHGEHLDRRNPNGMAKVAWTNPPEHPAKQAWIATVREHTPDIAAFNAAWGSEFESFDELSRSTDPYPPVGETALATCRAFVRKVAELYFGETAAAIRRHDPNHLVLGARFAGWAPDIWDIAGKHCDVVSFNNYPHIDIEWGVPHELIEWYRQIYAQAQRPLMMTEWSFLGVDLDLPSSSGGGMKVRNQTDRAQCFRSYQSTLLSLPFFVGSHYFMYADEPLLGIREYFPEDGNYGLVNYREEPYEEFVNTVAEVQEKAVELHQAGTLGHVFEPRPGFNPAALDGFAEEGARTDGNVKTGRDAKSDRGARTDGNVKTGRDVKSDRGARTGAPTADPIERKGPQVVQSGNLELTTETVHGCGWDVRLWTKLDERKDPDGYDQDHPFYPHIVGRFDPVVLHGPADTDRTQSRTAIVTAIRSSDRFTVADLLFKRPADPGVTSPPGVYSYEVAWRFWFPIRDRREGDRASHASWFVSHPLSIRNTGVTAMPVEGLSHNVAPMFDTVPGRQNELRVPVRNYHLQVNAWELPIHQLGLGTLGLDHGMVVDFYRRRDVCWSDCFRPLDVRLEPGESYPARGGSGVRQAALIYAYPILSDHSWLDLAERFRKDARRGAD